MGLTSGRGSHGGARRRRAGSVQDTAVHGDGGYNRTSLVGGDQQGTVYGGARAGGYDNDAGEHDTVGFGATGPAGGWDDGPAQDGGGGAVTAFLDGARPRQARGRRRGVAGWLSRYPAPVISAGVIVICAALVAGGLGVSQILTAQSAANATANPNCTLIVPANPLTAQGLATPYQLTATDPAAGPCDEANMNQTAFVQGAVLNPGTGQISIYNPVVVDAGAQPAAAPVVPALPAGAVVAVWFGYNGTTLTLAGADQNLTSGTGNNATPTDTTTTATTPATVPTGSGSATPAGSAAPTGSVAPSATATQTAPASSTGTAAPGASASVTPTASSSASDPASAGTPANGAASPAASPSSAPATAPTTAPAAASTAGASVQSVGSAPLHASLTSFDEEANAAGSRHHPHGSPSASATSAAPTASGTATASAPATGGAQGAPTANPANGPAASPTQDAILQQANCVAGENIDGQFSSFTQVGACNATAFFTAANAAIKAGKLRVPAPGTGKDGKTCLTTRSFALIDQDQSDNVTTEYLTTGNGQVAQDTAANRNSLTGATALFNGSDNGLLDLFVDPALGCSPWEVPNLADAGAPAPGLPLDELQAAAWAGRQGGGQAALVPLNDPMTVDNNGNFSTDKTNTYRSLMDMPQLPAGESPAAYCSDMEKIQGTRLQQDVNLLINGPSPMPAAASNLFTFLGMRLQQSFMNLNCGNFGMNNDVSTTADGNGVVVAACFADQVRPITPGAGNPTAGQRTCMATEGGQQGNGNGGQGQGNGQPSANASPSPSGMSGHGVQNYWHHHHHG